MPYALLGILAVGTAIGAGLSVSNGANTVTDTPPMTLAAAFKMCTLEMGPPPNPRHPSAIRSEYQGFLSCMGNEGFIIGSRDGRLRWVPIA